MSLGKSGFDALWRKYKSLRQCADALRREYESLRQCAPARHERDKKYFVDSHRGVPSSGRWSNRREEHCAIALVNLGRDWEHPCGGSFRFLDYQFPLKARQSDCGIGKVDLVGVNDRGRFIVAELKVGNKGNSSPDKALIQGLHYATIVEKNLEAIRKEAKVRFNVHVSQEPPIVQLLATEAWWRQYGFSCDAAGDEQKRFAAMVKVIESEIGVVIECWAFDRLDVEFGLEGKKPRFSTMPNLRLLCLCNCDDCPGFRASDSPER